MAGADMTDREIITCPVDASRALWCSCLKCDRIETCDVWAKMRRKV